MILPLVESGVAPADGCVTFLSGVPLVGANGLWNGFAGCAFGAKGDEAGFSVDVKRFDFLANGFSLGGCHPDDPCENTFLGAVAAANGFEGC